MAAESFELKSGFNRVVIAVQERDQDYVMESGVHEVSDPAVIRALDEHHAVKRAESPKSEKK